MTNVTDIRRQTLEAQKGEEFFIALDTLVTDYIEEGLGLPQIITYLQVVNVALASELVQALYDEE